MKSAAYILIVLISTINFKAYADTTDDLRPLPFEECQSQYPEGLLGTWRLDHEQTDARRLEQLEEARFSKTPDIAQRDASTITFTEKTIVFSHPWSGDITRDYSALKLPANKFRLKYSDKTGATLEQNAELVPCGLVLEQESGCTSNFCKNLEEEDLRTSQPNTGSEYYEESIAIKLKRRIQKLAERESESTRAYYRKVDSPPFQHEQ